MKIQNFTPFAGNHCETTATGTLLHHIGIELSEPMLFGLGEGLGFIFWNSKQMDFPFIGGRIKPDALTENISKRLNLQLEINESSSTKKAWENVKHCIDENIPVGLKLDCYHLEYFTSKIHFAAHYVAMYGYDDEYAYLIDTLQQGKETKTSLKSLELARNEKGPMSSKNLSYTFRRGGINYNLKEAIITAIRNNAQQYINPSISNVGYRGIAKASEEIKKWFRTSKNIKGEFKTMALLMEGGGTGGALFRNLFKDFLKESFDLLKISELCEASESFTEIALMWRKVAGLFEKTSETNDVQFIHQASDILVELSRKEKAAMELLSKV